MSVFGPELPPPPAKLLPATATEFLRQRKKEPRSQRGIQKDFQAVPGVGYVLTVIDLSIRFDVSRLRSRFEETHGFLTVRVMFKGALTVADNILSAADFNLSSLRARQERAKHLHERARADEIDWDGLLEDLCLRVLSHEENGQPAIPLSDIPSELENRAEIEAGTLPLLRNHPTIWFGDGASGKSLFALWAAIDLAQQGYRVLYLDWELDGESHSHRLQRFIGPAALKDRLFYRRCERSFERDVLPIREQIARLKANFLICDSIGFGAQGAPESAEAATGYFKALRECGPLGSLHLAHVNRSEQGDQKPFGSVFWHAGARATWYLKRSKAEETNSMAVGFYNRKSNLGQLRTPFAREVIFDHRETRIELCDITNITDEDMVKRVALSVRIAAALRDGPLSLERLADELDADSETIRRTVRRNRKDFVSNLGADGRARIQLVSKSV